MKIQDKLEKPDFEGRWDYKGTSSGFYFYILNSERFRGAIDQFKFAELGDKIEIVEGVIKDDYGLATFSGNMGNVGLEFHKDYSTKAQSKGALGKLFYYGYAKDAIGCDKSELSDIEKKIWTNAPKHIPDSPSSVTRYEGVYTSGGRRTSRDDYVLGDFWMKRVA